jgi:hypothetical protein
MCDFCAKSEVLWSVCCDVKLQASWGACDECYKKGCWTAATRVSCYDCNNDAVGVYGEEPMCADCRDEIDFRKTDLRV